MKRMTQIARYSIFLALLTSALGGCSTSPTAPSVETEQTAAATHTAPSAGLITGTLDLLKGLIVRTVELVGSIGGTLSSGRWTVVIPKNAVDGNATVALGVASSTSASCQLEIFPSDKNQFSTPVTLTVNCSNVSLSTLKTYVIRWYDPSTGKWVPVPGSKVDLTKKTVSAPLYHFSKYSVGSKAGW